MGFGAPYQTPLKYLGRNQAVVPTVQAPREPTVNDKNYPIQTIWRIERNPDSGAEGDQWMLVKFDTANGDAIWRQLELTGGAPTSDLNTLSADSGTDPVLPDGSGNISITGEAAQGVSTVGGTNNIEIAVADATTSSKGVIQADNTYFTVSSGTLSLASAPVNTLTGDTGGAIAPSSGNINIVGSSGFTFDGSGSTLTMNAPGSIGFTWTEVTGTSQAMAVSNGYVANNASLVTLTLPATAAIGDVVRVIGKGAGLYSIAQNAGQTINVVGSSTTTGVGGSLTAVEQWDAVEIRCITANTDWAVASMTGNFTIV